MTALNPAQQQAVTAGGHNFWQGPAGCGKSTALHERLRYLLQTEGESAYTILTLVGEIEARDHFLDSLHRAEIGPYAELKILTYTGLAREMVTLFWPLVARPAGFNRPHHPPTFLSYDLAQLLMWDIVHDALRGGTFANIRLRPQQIVSQVLDTLNRAALNRFTIAGVVERQIETWTGEAEHIKQLRQVQAAAQTFRDICRANNLLDLSLTVAAFDRHLVDHAEFSRYFQERFRHLLVDNVEEQTPAGQHFISQLMPVTVSTTLVYDEGGGYKRFLSADPAGARTLAEQCRQTIPFDESFTAPTPVIHLANLVDRYLVGDTGPVDEANGAILATVIGQYRRDLIYQLMPLLRRLVDEDGIPPYEIAIVTPYLDGALNHSLSEALKEYGLPYLVLRRRSSPREEPRVRAWLTWLALAHPGWGITPASYDVAEALALSIHGLDPARAALATEHLYDIDLAHLRPSEILSEELAARIGPDMLDRIDQLRAWLEAAGGQHNVDTFLYHLFNDLLAQPEFQPEPDLAGAAICDWLVQTAGRLRGAAAGLGLASEMAIGQRLIEGINEGLVTANPPDLGDPPDPDGVLVATTYGFLLSGRTARVQVWLETATTGWWDIPRQPLSNVFVMAGSWAADRLWTMEEEIRLRNSLLSQVVRGLATRCTEGVILAHSELDRRGQRQDGHLWRALQFIR